MKRKSRKDYKCIQSIHSNEDIEWRGEADSETLRKAKTVHKLTKFNVRKEREVS